MSKTIIIVFVAVILGIAGFFFYKNISPVPQNSKINQLTTQPTEQLSPIFSYLPSWVPAATWSTPQSVTEETPYGKLTGLKSTGEITGTSDFKGRNFEDVQVMNNLGFKTEDIKFAADGPGSSQWGYTQTEGDQSWVVIFSYSTNRLLGPESKSKPFANMSVFVSDSFKMK